jgi:hypothetical protein
MEQRKDGGGGGGGARVITAVMSLITLKRRAESTVGVASTTQSADGFSIHGRFRNPGSVVGGGRQANMAYMPYQCTPENTSQVKRAVMSNAGMLATRFPKSAYTRVVGGVPQLLSQISHQDYIAHLRRRAIKTAADDCPEAPPPAPPQDRSCLPCAQDRRSLERAWARASRAPARPDVAGAKSYSEWLTDSTVCAYSNEVFSIVERVARARLRLNVAQAAAQKTTELLVVAQEALTTAQNVYNFRLQSQGELDKEAKRLTDAAVAAQKALDEVRLQTVVDAGTLKQAQDSLVQAQYAEARATNLLNEAIGLRDAANAQKITAANAAIAAANAATAAQGAYLEAARALESLL